MFIIITTRLEKPHMGCWGVPFMKSTMGFSVTICGEGRERTRAPSGPNAART